MFKKTKKKILLIEDDALLIKIMMSEIEKAGFEVVNVDNGLNALEIAQKIKPDLILLDIILPGLDGFEILKQIRADRKLKNTIVFVVSNLSSESDIKSAKALAADEYFIKANIDIENIIKAIKKKLKK